MHFFNIATNTYTKIDYSNTYEDLPKNTPYKWVKQSRFKKVQRKSGEYTETLLKNNYILTAGGDDSNIYGFHPHVVQLYDIKNNKTYLAGTLNYRRYRHSATRLKNGDVLLIGGKGGNDPEWGYYMPVLHGEVFKIRH